MSSEKGVSNPTKTVLFATEDDPLYAIQLCKF